MKQIIYIFAIIVLIYLFNAYNKSNIVVDEEVYLEDSTNLKSTTDFEKTIINDNYIDNYISAYIQRFLKVAEQEQKKYGIPVSIKLAQGILESDYGRSKLAVYSNNHFGIKYYGKKNIYGEVSDYVTGYAILHDDCKREHKKVNNLKEYTDKNKIIVSVKDNIICENPDKFVKYDRAWASYRHHSLLLMADRYQIYGTDNNYKSWLYALKMGKYATDSNYYTKLDKIITELNLNQYDE